MTPLFLRLTEGITLPLGNLAFYKTSPTLMEVHSLATNPPLRVATVSGIDLQALEMYLEGAVEVTVGPNGVLDLPAAWRARTAARNAFPENKGTALDMAPEVMAQFAPQITSIPNLWTEDKPTPKSKPGEPKLVDLDVIRKKLQNL